MIEARQLTVDVSGRRPFEPLDALARPGEVTALVGPSGSGKTTALHAMGLLLTPASGVVLVDGQDTSSWSPRQRRRFWAERAAFILQDSGVMDEETVGFNVTVAMSWWGRRVAGDLSRMRAALSATGLEGREKEPAAHLSGGEKQRLALARAIYARADVIFADEPTASLDAGNREVVTGLLQERAADGAAVVVATHDESLMRAADQCVEVRPTAPQ
ncbi:putative ABC transport system ATP-binding protein [Kytococcus aerolatus]|uniref:Putative ABC transport system ATP-binding protein n=1 Tax=Kytococcus aerolatus TaxID=592308 RepID=A0A212U6D5_9MICO|nr:ATP-binding cassette domain-containing protein [Kytococcus aerolatus]SNC73789.1 putative ABC transport system ATP-binding protein [Kytococcus aerolatus]